MPKGYSANWVFTINNPTADDYQTISDLEKQPNVLSLKAESEKGKKGTPHFQGAVQFQNDVSKKTACRRLGGRAWTQRAFGTWADQDYCLKDPVPIKVGDEEGITLSITFGDGWKGQGNRTELEEFRDAVLEGGDDEYLLNNHLREIAKYPRLEGRLKAHRAKMASYEFRKVSVYVYFGTGGSGKSKRALYDMDGKRNRKAYVVPKTENCKWFQDYDGEHTIVFNDFYGGSMKFSRWLDMCDGHQFQVETKGGHTYGQWTTIIFTSNQDPDQWYQGAGKDMRDVEYSRRFTKIWDMDNDCIKTY